MRRRCLRIGGKVGFLFGSGLPANFLAEYYGSGEYGPARAAWLLMRAFFSALWQGPFIRKLFKRFEGSVRVDGKLLEQNAFVGLMAGTVREVGLGFKLVHRADDDPERFGVLAMHSAVLSLTLDIWAVQRGRGIAPQPGLQRGGLRRWTSIRRTAAWLTRSTATSTGRRTRSRYPSGRPSCS